MWLRPSPAPRYFLKVFEASLACSTQVLRPPGLSSGACGQPAGAALSPRASEARDPRGARGDLSVLEGVEALRFPTPRASPCAARLVFLAVRRASLAGCAGARVPLRARLPSPRPRRDLNSAGAVFGLRSMRSRRRWRAPML